MHWTLPNIITLVRIGLTPVIALLPFIQGYWPKVLAFVIFCAAAISDTVDGYLARKHNQVSELGQFLDPIADKLLLFATRHVGRDEELIGELARAEVQRGELGQTLIERRVRNASGVQLLVDVRREPHLLHAFDIARLRTEADPIEDVDDGAGVRLCGHRRSLRRDRAGQKCDQASRGNDRDAPPGAKR